MIEEIDLRAYIGTLLRHWPWIVGLAVGAAIIGFAISSLQPNMYRASAMVLVTEPRYQLQFDSRLRTDEVAPSYIFRALPALATSPEVLQAVIDALTLSPQAQTEEWSITTLLDTIRANSLDERSMVILEATSRFSKDAAAIANQWADAFAQHCNETFGGTQDDVVFFEEQLEQARQALSEADTALIEFQARDESKIIGAELDSLSRALAEYLAQQRTIGYTIQDIEGFRKQLADQSDDQPLSRADYLTALLLQIKAFNAQDSTPIELQLDSSKSLSDKSRAEQITFFNSLVAVLKARSSEIDGRLAELEPQILALQEKVQALGLEESRLEHTRELAKETYFTLSRKVDEVRIAAQEQNKMFQIGSYAVEPEFPIGRRRLLKTAVAGALGLVIGVFGAFLLEFWRRDRRQAQSQND